MLQGNIQVVDIGPPKKQTGCRLRFGVRDCWWLGLVIKEEGELDMKISRGTFGIKRQYVLAMLFLQACAFGDGQGFASVQGVIQFVPPPEFGNDSMGRQVSLDRMTLVVGSLNLETSIVNGAFYREQIPIGLDLSIFQGEQAVKFGSIEVDEGLYSRISLRIDSVFIQGTVGEIPFETGVDFPEGLVVANEAVLPVNDGEPPNITMTVLVRLPGALFGALDLHEDSKLWTSEVMTNWQDQIQLDANWIRNSD